MLNVSMRKLLNSKKRGKGNKKSTHCLLAGKKHVKQNWQNKIKQKFCNNLFRRYLDPKNIPRKHRFSQNRYFWWFRNPKQPPFGWCKFPVNHGEFTSYYMNWWVYRISEPSTDINRKNQGQQKLPKICRSNEDPHLWCHGCQTRTGLGHIFDLNPAWRWRSGDVPGSPMSWFQSRMYLTCIKKQNG